MITIFFLFVRIQGDKCYRIFYSTLQNAANHIRKYAFLIISYVRKYAILTIINVLFYAFSLEFFRKI